MSNLSEEEKRAIEILKSKRPSEQMLISGKICIDILLNLIEKLEKELEEEKRNSKELETFIQENPPIIPLPDEYRKNIEETGKISEIVTINKKEYISKDKIREKIKELEKFQQQFSITVSGRDFGYIMKSIYYSIMRNELTLFVVKSIDRYKWISKYYKTKIKKDRIEVYYNKKCFFIIAELIKERDKNEYNSKT